MLGIVFSLFSVFLLVFMLYKKINAHMALLLSGLLLLSLAAIFGLSPHIVAKGSLNLGFFDIFQVFNQTMSSTLAGLGLTLMTIAGFSAYMDHVGASYALFKVFEKPLKAVKSHSCLFYRATFSSFHPFSRRLGTFTYGYYVSYTCTLWCFKTFCLKCDCDLSIYRSWTWKWKCDHGVKSS